MSSQPSSPVGSPPYVDDDGKTDAEKYLEGCLDGSIVAGKKIKKLAEMMLPRFHESHHGFVYSPERATRVVEFIERFCRIPSAENMGMPFILEPYERMIVELAFGFVDEEGYRQFREVLVEIARKNGKSLSLLTIIPTPSGWRKMGDIHVGDKVFGQDGRPSTVIAESEVFYDKPMYLVTFEDGAKVKATHDHIWTVQTKGSRRCAKDYKPGDTSQSNRRKYREGGWFETTTQEMFDDPCFVYHRADGKGVEYKYRVPMCLPVEYPEKDLPVDPYTLGYWLGDGHANGPELTVGLQDLDAAFDILHELGHKWTLSREHDNTYKMRLDGLGGGKPNPFASGLREIGVLNDKHIPDMYLQASVEQRWELLRGLMDTDGYVSKAGQCQFTQKRKHLVEQFVELCSSLGIKANMHSKEARCNGKPAGTVYTVEFWTDKDHSCFRLKRKHDRLKDKLADRMKCKSIVSIERIPNEPSKCIAIDNPSHLYLVGRNYTATHNTSLLAAINNYMLIADGEPAAECYNGATTVQQAKLCYGSTWEMVRMSPHLKKYIRKGIVQKRGITGLNYDANGSYLCTISSRSDSLDGLNMHLGVLDELAASKTPDTYRLLTGAMSARRQPLLVSISTNGKIRNGIWDDRLDYANRILNGDVTDDRFLPILFEQDSKDEVFAGLDEEYRYLWEKSNPGLGTVKKIDSMYDLVKRAFDNRADLPEVLMKQFNIPALEYEAFLEYEDCVNPETFEIDPEVDRYCVVGFDLSMSGDISSACAMFRRAGDDRVYELTANWITERKMEVNLKGMKGKDGVPYHVWAQEGWLTVVEGDKIDQVVVVDWINSLVDMGLYPIAIGYDKWHVDDWTKRTLSQVAGDKRVHEVPPGAQTMSPLMQEHKIDLRAKRVINPSPVTAWARMNVQASTTNTGDYSPKKKDLDVTKKIDPYMAELYALKAYKLHEEEYLALIGDPKVVTG